MKKDLQKTKKVILTQLEAKILLSGVVFPCADAAILITDALNPFLGVIDPFADGIIPL
ncbi:MAG: hypothetical protein ACP5G4_11515 [bacterium]